MILRYGPFASFATFHCSGDSAPTSNPVTAAVRGGSRKRAAPADTLAFVATSHDSASPLAPAADPAFRPPSLARRFGALSIDWVLCLLATNLYADPIADSWAPVLTLIAVYGLFVGLFAQTPGMRLCRLRCVADADGGRIGIPRALLRGALLGLVLPALVMNDRGRGLHDRAVGSIVVGAPAAPAS